MQEEQAAKAKAEKIRVALEKIKEAQVKKVGVPKSCINVYVHVVYCLFFIYCRSESVMWCEPVLKFQSFNIFIFPVSPVLYY